MTKDYFLHPSAIIEKDVTIGEKSRVWAFTHILSGAIIGSDCNICDHVFVESDVTIGNRVTIKCGVQVWDGITIEDDVFIGPNVTFTNDPFPRSKKHLSAYPKTLIQAGASIGANATINPGITIGQYAMIGAGSVVTKDVPAYAIVYGNPARINGYANQNQLKVEKIGIPDPNTDSDNSNLTLPHMDARLIRLKNVMDMRGELSFTEYGNDLPFIPKRCFWVYNVPSREVRGEHAHKLCAQFLIAVSGSVSVVLDDGANRLELELNKPYLGLYIPPGIWGIQYKYSQDAILVVLASHEYDASDYIRNYQDFIKYKSGSSI